MSSILSRRSAFLLIIVLAALTGVLAVNYFDAAANSKEANPTPNRSKGPNLVDLARKKASCCNTKATETASFSAFAAPEYQTYKLTATYYTLRNGIAATLMLNN